METMTQDQLNQVFPVGTPAALSLNTVSGQVTVRVGDDAEIRVHAVKEGADSTRSNTRIDVQQDGNRVSIQTHGENGGFGGWKVGKSLASVTYEITVPRECDVAVKGVSADVSVVGPHGRAQIQTVSGDVEVAELQGQISVTTVSGDVSARELRGGLTLHTTSGDARIIDSALGDFNLHSVSGDFSIETPLTHGRHYYAKTVSGDLKIAVPEGTGVTVQMRSISGDVVSDFRDAEIIRSGRRHWQGRINGGGANVEMHSVSGDLRITRASAGASAPPFVTEPSEPSIAPPPPMPPEAPRAPESPTDDANPARDASGILSLLEQGEIDVEEALARLQGSER